MNILVIGCDQVGAALIRDLARIGPDISVVERDPGHPAPGRRGELRRRCGGDRGGLGEPDGGAAGKEHLPPGQGHLPGVRPASADPVPQGLRAGDHLPHRTDRAGGVPGTFQVRSRFLLYRPYNEVVI